MDRKIRNRTVKISCVLLALIVLAGILIHVSGSECYFSGAAAEYYQSLLKMGFPEDYAISLTELHLLHPTWSFQPLLITEGKSSYTWSYVISQETKEPDNNLISSDESHKPYRHPTNSTQYDAGHYQASTGAVEYFMDPRNFLNETDIFQFYDLSSASNINIEAVESILASTFMKDAILENGLTYAAYFVELGKELHVDPIYLAVKARQEQGVGGTSPVISGTCGTLLNGYYQNHTQYSESGNAILTPSVGYTSEELLSYNGLYNFYNVSTYGNGLFEIYCRAMKRAKTGTADMADAWGSPEWNTLWKSIYGGAYTIKTSYIDRYQNTIYLQKFNVDSRSNRNFWGQYMQNVGGALTEARTLYSSFASNGALDSECTFLIPVYKGMPDKPCPDPANGSCSYLATANRKFDYSVSMTAPFSESTENSPLYLSQEIYSDQSLDLAGIVEHSYGLKNLEYSWDGGEWILFSEDRNMDFSIPHHFSAGSSHILVVRGTAAYDHAVSSKKSNYNFLCSVIYVDILPPPTATLRLVTKNGADALTYPIGETVTFPNCEEAGFIGWIGKDNSFLFPNSEITLTEDRFYQALYLNLQHPDGAALLFSDGSVRLRFYAALEEELWETLNRAAAAVRLSATVSDVHGTSTSPVSISDTVDAHQSTWRVFHANTPHLPQNEWKNAQTVSFSMLLTDSSGVEKEFALTPNPVTRSAKEVAARALNDPDIVYSFSIFQKLLQIAPDAK